MASRVLHRGPAHGLQFIPEHSLNPTTLLSSGCRCQSLATRQSRIKQFKPVPTAEDLSNTAGGEIHSGDTKQCHAPSILNSNKLKENKAWYHKTMQSRQCSPEVSVNSLSSSIVSGQNCHHWLSFKLVLEENLEGYKSPGVCI